MAMSNAESNTVPSAVLAEIPTDALSKDALSLAQSSLPPSIFNHSLRVYLYARAFQDDRASYSRAVIAPVSVSPRILFVACILHDLGTASRFDGTPDRFEVAGADSAAILVRGGEETESMVREAWLAIALHTSPHIAESMGGAVAALRLGVLADFGKVPAPKSVSVDLLSQLPRLDVESDLGGAVVRQAVGCREKAPTASWPGDLLRAWEAELEWNGVNKNF